MKGLIALFVLGLMAQGGFGLTELEQLAHDRPQLLTVIHPGDKLWVWLNAHFLDTLGCKVHWDNSGTILESNPTLALSGWPDNSSPLIEIATTDLSGKPIDGGGVLTLLMFELLNLEPRDERSKLDNLASRGEISENEYVKRGVMSEYKVGLELKTLGKTLIVPYLKKHHRPIPLELQAVLSISDDPDVYWKGRIEHPDDYLNHFKRDYKLLSGSDGETPTPPSGPSGSVL